ncbi:MAG TPA: HAMP domain-containing sensor histidine kinase [Acidimicrobiales bacterium]|nr:HAMP domain-containing sensor histidine kinase [Acidimicrobiales bacterium]
MSLRTRLLIAIGVIALAALAIANVATYSSLQSFLYQRVDQQLDQQHLFFERLADRGEPITQFCHQPAQPAQSAQPAPGGGSGAPGSPIAGPSSNLPPNLFPVLAIEIQTRSGGTVNGQVCPAYEDNIAYTPKIPTPIPGLPTPTSGGNDVAVNFVAPSTQPDGPSFRVRASALVDGNVLIVAEPLQNTEETLHRLLLIELAVTGAAVILALIGGFWLVRVGLRPLRDMERSAESIAAGNLTERVPGENDSTEVGRLAKTLNVMLSRIEAAFGARLASERRLRASEERLRRFVADASHELRTPIAAVSAYAELFGRGASEQKEDLGRLMAGIRTETDRMEHLVADLLLLARLDEGRPMDRRSVDLVALCAEAVQTASTVGPAWPLTFEASEPIEIMGDATSLRQVIDNLLGNVRAHTPAGTPARVTVAKEEGGAVITVADDGPGMEPDEAAHIFERFYRSDPSRSRRHGGAGLGLSIVSAIVANHGGSVSAEGGAGTTFTVHLPAVPPPADPGPDEGASEEPGGEA